MKGKKRTGGSGEYHIDFLHEQSRGSRKKKIWQRDVL